VNGAASLGSLFFYGYRAGVTGFAFFVQDTAAFWNSYYLKVSRPRLNHPCRIFSLNLFFCGCSTDFHPCCTSLLVWCGVRA